MIFKKLIYLTPKYITMTEITINTLDDIRFKPVALGDHNSRALSESLQQKGFESLRNRWSAGTLWIERGLRLKDLKKE